MRNTNILGIAAILALTQMVTPETGRIRHKREDSSTTDDGATEEADIETTPVTEDTGGFGGGFRRQELVTVAASQSTGRTSFSYMSQTAKERADWNKAVDAKKAERAKRRVAQK